MWEIYVLSLLIAALSDRQKLAEVDVNAIGLARLRDVVSAVDEGTRKIAVEVRIPSQQTRAAMDVFSVDATFMTAERAVTVVLESLRSAMSQYTDEDEDVDPVSMAEDVDCALGEMGLRGKDRVLVVDMIYLSQKRSGTGRHVVELLEDASVRAGARAILLHASNLSNDRREHPISFWRSRPGFIVLSWNYQDNDDDRVLFKTTRR